MGDRHDRDGEVTQHEQRVDVVSEMLERLGTSPMYPDAMELDDILTVLEALERAGVRYGPFGLRLDEDR